MYRKKKELKSISSKRLALLSVTAMILLAFVTVFNSTSVSAEEPKTTASTEKAVSSKTIVPITTDQAGLTPGTGTTADITNDTSLTAPVETLPDIEIYIDVPDGYYSDKVTVTFRLQTKDGSMPEISSVKAKAGKKGKYEDVTDTMSLTITENGTVHVTATDNQGRTYERSRNISCFDKEAPTLNASVSEGILEVVAKDSLSGVKSIIVNGYEYTDLKDGKLTIRLSQFDAGYEKFYAEATDKAGNRSTKYTVKNPYKKNKDSNSDYDPATELPENVEPTDIGDATGDVTEHLKVDEDGNVIVPDTGIKDGEIKETGIGLDEEYEAYTEPVEAREFYAITTESGKVFYLIIDRTTGKEVVRFLTDITENDLLHVTKNNSQSLPRNSAAKDSGVEIKESAIGVDTPVNDGYSDTRQMTDEEVKKADEEQAEATPTPEPQKETSFIKKNMSYIVMGGIALIAIIAGYYFKVVKKRRENASEDDAEEEEDNTSDTEDDYISGDNNK